MTSSDKFAADSAALPTQTAAQGAVSGEAVPFLKVGDVFRDHRYEPELEIVGCVTEIAGKYAISWVVTKERHGVQFRTWYTFKIGTDGIEVLK